MCACLCALAHTCSLVQSEKYRDHLVHRELEEREWARESGSLGRQVPVLRFTVELDMKNEGKRN